MEFCTKCGKKIIEGQTCDCSDSASTFIRDWWSSFMMRVKTWPAITKKLLKVIAILIAADVVFAVIGAALTAPINTARDYVNAKEKGNWGKAYDYYLLSEPESEFINKDSFIKLHENTNITNSDIRAQGGNSFMANYYVDDATTGQYESIELVRSGSRLLFFNRYKINPENIIVSDYYLSIPHGVTVYMDGINLEVPSNGTIVIPQIFAGQHELIVEHPACDNFTELIPIGKTETSSYSVSSLKLGNSIKSGLASKTEDIYRRMVTAAIEGNSFDTLDIPYTSDSNYSGNVIVSYEQMVSFFNRQDGSDQIKSINVTNFIDNSTQLELHAEGTYTCEMAIECNYTYIPNDGDGNTAEYSETDNIAIVFTYMYENDEWVIQNMQTGFDYYW